MAIAPLPDPDFFEPLPAARPALRLLSIPGDAAGAADLVVPARLPGPAGRHPVRRTRLRRRGIVVLLAGLLAALALPVSALGGTVAPSLVPGTTYVVQPGDTLRSIALRLQPGANPAPLVAEMAAETGSRVVVAGEHLALP